MLTHWRKCPQRRMFIAAFVLMISTSIVKLEVAQAAAPEPRTKLFVVKHLPDTGHAHTLEVRAIAAANASGLHAHLDDLISLAEARDPVAEYWLGRYYVATSAKGTRRWKWGIRWLQDSEGNKCRRAAYQLYKILSHSETNARLSEKSLVVAARLGWPPAQYLFALQLLRGRTNHINEALHLLAGAAQSGYVRAIDMLFKIAANGKILAAYRHEALYGLQQAADQRSPIADGDAAFILYFKPHPEYLLALDDARWGAAGGNAEADFVLGLCYYHGNGVEVNLRRAFTLLNLASKHGVRGATVDVGAMLLCGTGTKADPKLGLSRLDAAFRAGSGRAAYSLGMYFLHGHSPDLPAAEKWLKRAIHLGGFSLVSHAMFDLGLLRISNAKTAQEERAGFYLVHRAASEGYVRAEYYAGAFYANGIGVAPNRKKAIIWLEKAASGTGLLADKAKKLLASLRSTTSSKK